LQDCVRCLAAPPVVSLTIHLGAVAHSLNRDIATVNNKLWLCSAQLSAMAVAPVAPESCTTDSATRRVLAESGRGVDAERICARMDALAQSQDWKMSRRCNGGWLEYREMMKKRRLWVFRKIC
jgi:hypothetical protein